MFESAPYGWFSFWRLLNVINILYQNSEMTSKEVCDSWLYKHALRKSPLRTFCWQQSTKILIPKTENGMQK